MSRRWVAFVALCLLIALGFGFLIGSGLGRQMESDRQAVHDITTLQAAFDKGFAAGQEYEEWFCTNEVKVTP